MFRRLISPRKQQTNKKKTSDILRHKNSKMNKLSDRNFLIPATRPEEDHVCGRVSFYKYIQSWIEGIVCSIPNESKTLKILSAIC